MTSLEFAEMSVSAFENVLKGLSGPISQEQMHHLHVTMLRQDVEQHVIGEIRDARAEYLPKGSAVVTESTLQRQAMEWIDKGWDDALLAVDVLLAAVAELESMDETRSAVRMLAR
jgi:uncharacterized protein YbdZ (MbtH family)